LYLKINNNNRYYLKYYIAQTFSIVLIPITSACNKSWQGIWYRRKIYQISTWIIAIKHTYYCQRSIYISSDEAANEVWSKLIIARRVDAIITTATLSDINYNLNYAIC